MIFKMPGKGHTGALPPFSEEELDMSARLRGHVSALASDIGPRSLASPEGLEAAASYIENTLAAMGYEYARQEFTVYKNPVRNISVEIPGNKQTDKIIVVGAHYDTVPGTPGADDNASAVAGLLELAREFYKDEKTPVTLRFIFFVNEEPPFFQTSEMGSWHAAMESKEKGEDIQAMLCLESIGLYSDEQNSQGFPSPLQYFYPDTGNFIAFVSNWRSRELLYKAIGTFRDTTAFPSEGLVAPLAITGTDWSDHWSYWQAGYRAIMITDTALFRNNYYHTSEDTPEKLDYERTARVLEGIRRIIETLAK
ncbi:MAG: M20/M25/M40 family metallo-hydrolase [Thermodesulfovibrionales bacterium]|nr:M20/M25/M40 family metallo-hydrolase [Thermodesulfovibrionales bacterium]